MTGPVPADGVPPARSPFAGADLCAQTGFQLPPQAVRPMFDHDVWDFAAVAGLPVSMTPASGGWTSPPSPFRPGGWWPRS